MKCLIPGPNVKIFARAIHSLAKIGDELHIEPVQDGLILKTVNSSRSAYSAFNFHIPFFLNYIYVSDSTASANQEEQVIKCKLPMKSILSVFRCIGNLEKTVETCKISLPLTDALLIIELKCKHGIVKLYNLRYFDCEMVEAEFTKEGYASKFTCSSRFYSEALQSFHSSVGEVTWSLTADRVHLSNYIDDEQDPSKCVRTEVTLAKEEFEEFNVALCTQVTFCLKELRAILSFAEALVLELQCRMEGAGNPVLFSLNKDTLYSADFLLATLSPSLDSTPSSAVTLSQRGSVQNSPLPVMRDASGSHSSSLRATSTNLLAVSDVPEHFSRLNSLSLLDPNPITMDVEVLPPPAKRARARHIFQRCLIPSQDPNDRLGELLAPDSDGDEV